MLKDLDLGRYPRIYIATGYTDLRMGITGLSNLVQYQFHLDIYDKGALFLFCGRRASSLKCLAWDGDGFVLLTKKLVNGRYQWPRTSAEVRALTGAQFRMLMDGFSVESAIPHQAE